MFSIVLILPIVNYNVGIWKFTRTYENRVFKDTLLINLNNLDLFPKEADEYINDNFSFRKPLLDLYHYIKFYYFKVSPHPERTIIGTENWYFLAEKEIKIYEGSLNFSDSVLSEFKQEWISREKYLDNLNIKHYWVIAPIKHYIYSEYLPFNVVKSKTRRVDQIKDYLKDSLPNLIIDPTEAFLQIKKIKKIYNQLDNHWNLTAGYKVSEIILSKIKKDFPNEKIGDLQTINWKDSILQQGIHYGVLGIEELYEIEKFPILLDNKSQPADKYNFTPIENFPYPWDYERRFINKEATNNLKVLFIIDSFGDRLIPFIKEPFKESVFIFDSWHYNINKSIIETVKPDIVVFLCLETHIEHILEYK